MVIGDPVEHSLGPKMYNLVYEKMGVDTHYVYIACKVKEESLEDAVRGIGALGIQGVSVTIPHKKNVMKYLDKIDDLAKKIGAVNTIVNDQGLLKGYNTDWLGVIKPIEKIVRLKNKKVAVLGAGGAARAAVFGFSHKGAKVRIYNRTLKKAKDLAKEFNCDYASLEMISDIKNMDIIFNATSVGLHPNDNQTPLPKKFITNKHIVFDAVYVPYETKLLQEAKEKEARTIHGIEMLLYQGIEQFKLYTGHDAPEDLMRKILLEHVK